MLLLERTTSVGECGEGEKEGEETSDERKKLLLAPESSQGSDEGAEIAVVGECL